MKRILTFDQVMWAYEKWCQGYTQDEVAKALFVSRALINRELRQVKKMKYKEPLVYKEGDRRKEPKWIPVNYRKITAEEKDCYGEDVSIVYDCVLPEDGQDVLITTYKGNVVFTTFYDDGECVYFDNWEDYDDVIAWMPLPNPFKKEEEEE